MAVSTKHVKEITREAVNTGVRIRVIQKTGREARVGIPNLQLLLLLSGQQNQLLLCSEHLRHLHNNVGM